MANADVPAALASQVVTVSRSQFSHARNQEQQLQVA
jgi:hypothetical protein